MHHAVARNQRPAALLAERHEKGVTLPSVATSETTVRPAQGRCALAVEWMLAIAVLLGVLSAAHHFASRGYLPQPFFFDPSDSLMDLYNPAYWAHRDGVYDIWHAVYPLGRGRGLSRSRAVAVRHAFNRMHDFSLAVREITDFTQIGELWPGPVASG
jgi:hypothetical protein